MQPGQAIEVFDGAGRACSAQVIEMGRKQVTIQIGQAQRHDRELAVRVCLAVGMPANDRMDALIEKATELGVHTIQPLVCERSVLRLDGERAAKKVAHWQAVAIAACEQSGRTVVPTVQPVQTLPGWLQGGDNELKDEGWARGVLSLRDAVSLRTWIGDLGVSTPSDTPSSGDHLRPSRFVFLSGPEGGLSPAEEQSALQAGWTAITLGARVLRADTAPLAALSVIGSIYEG